jgi:hypothetical protein
MSVAARAGKRHRAVLAACDNAEYVFVTVEGADLPGDRHGTAPPVKSSLALSHIADKTAPRLLAVA